jgi:uncharacterized protein involved in type VI secretion and phage assembly
MPLPHGKPFWGKYRAKVLDNHDPLTLGRIKVGIPDVLGPEVSSWALPAVPYAGNGVGLYLIPPVGAAVWIEFEHGEPDYPIWTGCYWETQAQLPAEAALPEVKVLKTKTATIVLDDLAGEIAIVTGNSEIKLSSQGIVIQHMKKAIVKIAAPTVSINDGALEVT